MNYYDSIAQIYDQTRWLTEPVVEEVADFILELVAATPETSFLEPGIGTGLNVLQIMNEFEEFCIKHYGSLEKALSSEAKFEIWAYRAV